MSALSVIKEMKVNIGIKVKKNRKVTKWVFDGQIIQIFSMEFFLGFQAKKGASGRVQNARDLPKESHLQAPKMPLQQDHKIGRPQFPRKNLQRLQWSQAAEPIRRQVPETHPGQEERGHPRRQITPGHKFLLRAQGIRQGSSGL